MPFVKSVLKSFIDFGTVPSAPANNGPPKHGDDKLRQRLERPIDDCGLSVRSVNSLKNSNINTLGDLVRLAEDDLLKVKNVGEKALAEIADLLQREQLNFGMRFEEQGGELVAVDQGTPPTVVVGTPGTAEGSEG